jgi:hypothetical protein
MKRIFSHLIIAIVAFYSILLTSCGGNDEFSSENTFNLDTLMVDPSSNIGDNFSVTWGVSTTGYPQFLIDIFLSDDEFIDPSDLRIVAEEADTDTNSDKTKSYFNQIFLRTSLEPGTNAIKFTHSWDKSEWKGDATTTENLSGKTKFVIGRFYHTQGLQIISYRTRLAIEVNFE